MVERFAACVGASREVRVYSGQAWAAVCSTQLVADLGDRWGVRPSKTYDLRPPTDILDAELAAAGRRPVRVRRVGIKKDSMPMYEWPTSDHNAVVLLDAMRAAIGDLGISRKWAALDTSRAALAAHQTKGAA